MGIYSSVVEVCPICLIPGFNPNRKKNNKILSHFTFFKQPHSVPFSECIPKELLVCLTDNYCFTN